jgi:hypothetical protein
MHAEGSRADSGADTHGVTLSAMTAKERVIADAPEEQAQAALVAARRTVPGDIVDEWGNMSSFMRSSSASVFKRLDGEERAEFGETLAESWGRRDRDEGE